MKWQKRPEFVVVLRASGGWSWCAVLSGVNLSRSFRAVSCPVPADCFFREGVWKCDFFIAFSSSLFSTVEEKGAFGLARARGDTPFLCVSENAFTSPWAFYICFLHFRSLPSPNVLLCFVQFRCSTPSLRGPGYRPAQVMISWFLSWSPALGSAHTMLSLLGILSLCIPPTHSL